MVTKRLKRIIKRKMTLKNYVLFMQWLQNDDTKINWEDYDQAAIEEIKTYSLYLNKEQTQYLNDNFPKYNKHTPTNLYALINSIPRRGDK